MEVRRRGQNQSIGLGAMSPPMTHTETPVVWPGPLGVGRSLAEACCCQCRVLGAVRTAVVSS